MDDVGRTSNLQEHMRDYLGTRGALLLFLGLVALAAGAWALTRHDAPAPYGMSGDTRPRLPGGAIASGTSMSVAEAIARRPAHTVAVHGYLVAAADDWPYLCTRLNDFTDCRGAPRLAIGLKNARWLFFGPTRLQGLETGCCAIGSWSPHPVVLRGRVRGRTLVLLSPSGKH